MVTRVQGCPDQFIIPAVPEKIMTLSLRKRLWLLLTLYAFGQFSALAQTCQQNTIVNVRDQKGKLVPGLQPASFQETLHGQPVKIHGDRVKTESPRVVLLIDVSGSVNRENHNLELAQYAAGNFITVSAIPHVALVQFADRILHTVGFDARPEEMLQKLADLDDGRRATAVGDSLMYAASLFDRPRDGDAVYLISDGVDNRSKFRRKDLQQKFLSSGVRLFCFILSNSNRPHSESEAARDDLQHLAEVTGGSIANVNRNESANVRERLNAALSRTYDTMKNFYQLEVEFPSNADTRRQWELQVVDEQGKKRKNVEVTYARNLTRCTPEPPQKK